ncbi:MAG: DUF7507 domain-containing protein, partial [Planctomycetota bacterium]
MITRCLKMVSWGTALVLVVSGVMAVGPARAQTPPSVDGDITDLIAFAQQLGSNGNGCGLVANDVALDPCLTETLVPCPPFETCNLGLNTFKNGFDQLMAVVAYDDRDGNTYLGFRMRGIVGDSDGDGDDGIDPTAECMPGRNVVDLPGIGSTERYSWNIDTNCDGQPDLIVTVTNDEVQVNNVTNVSATYAVGNGDMDLEVVVPGLNLPVIWRMVIWRMDSFVGSTTDGLSEDISGPEQCMPPNLDLTIEKTANPDVLCAGQTTTFTVTVNNTGAAELMVDLEDVLPVGLTYANNVTGDFTIDTVVGQTITFNTLAIPKGQSRSVNFDATADAECFGTVENVATVRGTFDSPCLDQPLGVGPIEARAQVTCQDDPCAEVLCEAPLEACDGDQITVSGTATNCSQDVSDLTITISDTQGVIGSQTYFDVPSGESRTLDVQVDFSCAEAGQQVVYTVVAYGENDCGRSSDAVSECTVTCLPEPCLELVCDGPADACDGDEVTISGTATNCSAGPEDITITISGPGGQLATQTYTDVPSGESRKLEATDTFSCAEAGQQVDYTVVAYAENSCGRTTDEECTVTITCKPQPCVEVTCEAPGAACDGDNITVSGTATNCSTGPEDILIEIHGPQGLIGSMLFEDVPAGESRTHQETFAHDCFPTPGVAKDEAAADGNDLTTADLVPYWAVATATNDCGQAKAESDPCLVACSPEPCVSVECKTPEGACDGDEITVSGTATNCSEGPEDITITISGPGGQIATQLYEDVPPGESRTLDGKVTFECAEPGEKVPYSVTADAANGCGEAETAKSDCAVICQPEPCVEIKLEGPDAGCDGEPIALKAEALNCSAGPEDITISIYDPTGGLLCEETYDDVPAGESRTLGCEVTLECDPGGQVTYSADATAENGCGSVKTQKVEASVACQTPRIDVEKTASLDEAIDGDIIKYTITVKNPGPVDLEKLTITDVICDYVTYQGGATPTPDSEPAIGTAGGTVVWTAPFLAVGAELTFMFEVEADCELIAGAEVTCVNVVDAEGFCGNTKAEDRDSYETVIRCEGGSCPRTPGFWTQQCAQKLNGSTKFTRDEVTKIASCVDDNSAYFDWADDFAGFCSKIDPERPMNPYKQLQRHFAALLANYCTGKLGLIAGNGDTIKLDLNAKIDCPGVDAETISELIKEIDDALINGKSDKYGALLECADGINNGNVPPAPECPKDFDTDRRAIGGSDRGGLHTNSDLGGIEGGDGSNIGLLELYSPTPNPFNSTTRIAYAVGGANGERVDIGIYNVSGRLVRKLISD